MNFYRGKQMQSGTAVSRGESDLYAMLKAAERQRVVPPFMTDQWVTLLATKPDYLWPDLAVYLDGPHHDRDAQALKDDVQNRYLTERGWNVLRIHYAKKPNTLKHYLVLEWIMAALDDGRTGKLWEHWLDEEAAP